MSTAPKYAGVKFTAPEGRLVSGHPMTILDKKNYTTKQVEIDPKTGLPRKIVRFQVAYAEQVFLTYIWPQLQQAAAQGYNGQAVPQVFAWKVKHANDLDDRGRRYGDREGCEGCYIVTFQSEGYPPKVFKQPSPSTFVEITNPDELKTGYHIVVEINAKHNGNVGNTAGLYMNPNQILLTRYDAEIFNNAADPNEAFAGMGQYVLQGGQPVGAGAQGAQNFGQGFAPQGGAPMGQPMQQPMMQPMQQPMMQPMQQPMMQPQGAAPMGQPMQQPQGMPQAQPMAQPQGFAPAHDFVNNAVGQPMMQPQGMPQAQPMGQPQGMPQAQPMGGMPSGTFPQR